jgi:uncharacterized coiled-coil DUF342 family protein
MVTTQTIVLLVSGIFTGSLIPKILDYFFKSKNDQDKSILMLVEQLQTTVNAYGKELSQSREEIHVLKKELDEWKEKYYQESNRNRDLSLEINGLRKELARFNKNIEKGDQ